MDAEIVAAAAAAVPYVAAAVRKYGAEVLARIQEAAADATVGLGGKILRRLLQRSESASELEAAVQDLAEDTSDEDRLAALRLQIRKVMAADQQLSADVSELMKGAGVSITAYGDRSVAAYVINGPVSTGDSTTNR